MTKTLSYSKFVIIIIKKKKKNTYVHTYIYIYIYIKKKKPKNIGIKQVPSCYNKDWKYLVHLLPTEKEHQHEVVDLLTAWNASMGTAGNDEKTGALTVEKLKRAVKAMAFFLSKIVTKPLDLAARKVNVYNKQYTTTLKDIPRVDSLFSAIGYQRSPDGVIWSLPILASEEEKIQKPSEAVLNLQKIDYVQLFHHHNGASYVSSSLSSSSEGQEGQKTSHQKQCHFLLCFHVLLTHLFDHVLPADLQHLIDTTFNPHSQHYDKLEGQHSSIDADTSLHHDEDAVIPQVFLFCFACLLGE
ncbi:hypothetical protein RFI_09781 [Reticulomyxa filosa]|uniref:Uncharacterized protein n=1 Tax=Reticulomyxa filosa TaxID=46433 RepID=X6NNR9_RETFI|nr:hypothetical protein RFI_09781 [Reticulomyxa filosa]|eukprot:ETO27354.1 hypothetical protein RFI_09781 [Reticulomyxa filosa]